MARPKVVVALRPSPGARAHFATQQALPGTAILLTPEAIPRKGVRARELSLEKKPPPGSDNHFSAGDGRSSTAVLRNAAYDHTCNGTRPRFPARHEAHARWKQRAQRHAKPQEEAACRASDGWGQAQADQKGHAQGNAECRPHAN